MTRENILTAIKIWRTSFPDSIEEITSETSENVFQRFKDIVDKYSEFCESKKQATMLLQKVTYVFRDPYGQITNDKIESILRYMKMFENINFFGYPLKSYETLDHVNSWSELTEEDVSMVEMCKIMLN